MTGNGHVRFGGGLPQKYRPDEGRQLGGGLPNQPFVISWAERHRFLAADLLAANNNPVAASPRLLRRALTLLPAGADGVRLRGDSGFYSADLMAECAKRGVRFSICAKRTTVIWAEMLSIPRGAWRPARDMRRASERGARGRQR